MRDDANDLARVPAKAIRDVFSYRPIRRILCATDLSRHCEGAVRRAEALAKRTDALLLLLHVIDERLSPQRLGRESTIARARLMLEARQPSSRAEIVVRRGTPYRTIARVANKWGADLVVLGARRRRSGVQFAGLTAERVIRTASCAVLIINREPKGPYCDVVFASELPAAFARVVSLTEQLGLLEGVRASIVQVLGQASRSMIYAASGVQSQIDRHMESMRQSSRAHLIAQLRAAGLDPARFTVIQKHGPPFEAIARVIEDVSPQLLVLGATRHPTLKRVFGTSVVNQVLRGVDCDVCIASAAVVERDDTTSVAVSDLVRDAGGVRWATYW